MSKSGEQMMKKREGEKEEKDGLEGLPMETSPYVQYKDLEDYKNQAYGTQGHLQPKPNQGGGGTDAPTLSGTGLPEGSASAVDGATLHGTIP